MFPMQVIGTDRSGGREVTERGRETKVARRQKESGGSGTKRTTIELIPS